MKKSRNAGSSNEVHLPGGALQTSFRVEGMWPFNHQILTV